MLESLDEVRIIAKDARGLIPADRRTLEAAANEFEGVARALALTQEALAEMQQRFVAINDQLNGAKLKIERLEIEALRREFPTKSVLAAPISMSSGWLTIQHNGGL